VPDGAPLRNCENGIFTMPVRNCSNAILAGKEKVPPDRCTTSGATVVGNRERISFNGSTIVSPACFGITPGGAVIGCPAVAAVRGAPAGAGTGAGIRSSWAGASAGCELADFEKNFFKASNMDRAGSDTARTQGSSSMINYNVF